ncbi:unnamed protein product [Caenorhabditis brenneri]
MVPSTSSGKSFMEERRAAAYKRTEKNMARYLRLDRAVKLAQLAPESLYTSSNGGSKEYSLAKTEVDIMINDYNGFLLLGWRGNIDIQAIINQYSPTLDYICGYTTKCKTSKKGKLFDDMKGNEVK